MFTIVLPNLDCLYRFYWTILSWSTSFKSLNFH